MPRGLHVRTADHTVLSGSHGRDRRSERHISKPELQAAVKHGRKEKANPGRHGDPRWRYTHNGVVYITDASSRHEITSWRLDDASINLAQGPCEGGAHAVLVVDHSGSMRKSDVTGYATRTAAVYDCLARDFVEAQIAAGAGPDVVVTVIEMSSASQIIIDKAPLDAHLAHALKQRSPTRARSDGNYLPALQMALNVLEADAPNRGTLMLLFLSDGAPSDHTKRSCAHGTLVWQQSGVTLRNGKTAFVECPHVSRGWECRKQVKEEVTSECVRKVMQIGDLLGRDRVVVGTVAFGPPDQDYEVLRMMGEALPRGSFQKLGLNAGGLRTAFSSLSSSLTTLRTDGGSRSLTLRPMEVRKGDQADDGSGMVRGADGWLIYNGDMRVKDDGQIKKMRFSLDRHTLIDQPLSGDVTGISLYKHPFAQGVERYVYRLSEIHIPRQKERLWYSMEDAMTAYQAERRGIRLVAKEAKHKENLGRRFQEDLVRVQTEAAEIARTFNRRVGGSRELQLNFLDVDVYRCGDPSYPNGEAWVLVEAELEGRFTKWNNNNGHVFARPAPVVPSSSVGRGGRDATSLGAICEDEEEEEEEEEEDGGGAGAGDARAAALIELPQCFSHFSYDHTGGKQLVCDLQGVWNATDGFELTDPVIHYVSAKGGRRHKNGGTDKGAQGVLSFFRTHRCGALCKQLGLVMPDVSALTQAAHDEARLCLICMDAIRATRFGPCRHASCCEGCAEHLKRLNERCPICRGPIVSIIERGPHVSLAPTLT